MDIKIHLQAPSEIWAFSCAVFDSKVTDSEDNKTLPLNNHSHLMMTFYLKCKVTFQTP